MDENNETKEEVTAGSELSDGLGRGEMPLSPLVQGGFDLCEMSDRSYCQWSCWSTHRIANQYQSADKENIVPRNKTGRTKPPISPITERLKQIQTNIIAEDRVGRPHRPILTHMGRILDSEIIGVGVLLDA